MLERWAAWPARRRWLVGITAVVLAAAIVWAMFVPLADWLARHDVGSAGPALLQRARDAARGRLLTLAAGLFAAGALVFTALNFNLSREGHNLSREGQVTDRYTKAIEQLGSEKLDVRIGGIYALERVARDSAKDHPTVMDVLTAFIREHSREPWLPSDAARLEQERSTRPDVQAAVTVVGRREATRDIRAIDLTGANLAHANLAHASLAHANLGGATLTRANLWFADLTEANLFGADLTGADLRHATLRLATLTGAADLTGADLGDARLTGADLRDARLTDVTLTHANLTDATLRGVTLTGVHLTEADLTGADLTEANLADANLTDATLTEATLTGADLTGANLTEAYLMDAADLTGADLTDVRLPPPAPLPEGWTVDSESNRRKRAD